MPEPRELPDRTPTPEEQYKAAWEHSREQATMWADEAVRRGVDLSMAQAEVKRLRDLAATATRAHTRAIHALAGNLEYPEAERHEMGAYLTQELQRDPGALDEKFAGGAPVSGSANFSQTPGVVDEERDDG